jgi:hypothetical protein
VILSDLYDFFQAIRERNATRYFGCHQAGAGLPGAALRLARTSGVTHSQQVLGANNNLDIDFDISHKFKVVYMR